MKRRSIVLACLVFVGCAHRVKNIRPAEPFDFAVLTQMAKYAQAAYADDAAIRALVKPAFGTVSIHTITATDNKFFVATSTVAQVQLVSIAGTANLENVLLDADITQDYNPVLKIVLHRGFSRAARDIYSRLKPLLMPNYHLQITGHSLGGAEAVILGMLLKTAGTPPEAIVTFGQPKVTNQAGVDAFSDLPLTRVVNEKDLIPELPLDPYRHIGPELVLFSSTSYSLVNARPIKVDDLVLVWKALQAHQPPPQIANHYIANYIADLEPKTKTSQLIKYR